MCRGSPWSAFGSPHPQVMHIRTSSSRGRVRPNDSLLIPGANPSGPLPQPRAQGPEGPASVADPVLLLRGELGHGSVPSGGLEDRVVAEPAGPARLRPEGPLAFALRPSLPTVRVGHRGDRTVPGGPAAG